MANKGRSLFYLRDRLTIGYGDLTPRHIVSRCLVVMIGFSGIVLTGLVAAMSVRALNDGIPRDSIDKSG